LPDKPTAGFFDHSIRFRKEKVESDFYLLVKLFFEVFDLEVQFFAFLEAKFFTVGCAFEFGFEIFDLFFYLGRCLADASAELIGLCPKLFIRQRPQLLEVTIDFFDERQETFDVLFVLIAEYFGENFQHGVCNVTKKGYLCKTNKKATAARKATVAAKKSTIFCWRFPLLGRVY
jgi:hypothetical protein